MQKESYELWIEAEEWEPNTWVYDDVDTDVLLTTKNNERWGATFVTYKHVTTLINRWKTTGESLEGGYVWVSDMILIDVATRVRIKEVIDDLIKIGYFESAFTRYSDD